MSGREGLTPTMARVSVVQEKNMSLVNQAIDRAPVWLIKKLTATYLTLGLGDIGKEVGIDSPEEVRATILSMVCL